MKTKAAITLISTVISLIVLTLALTAGDTYAGRRGRNFDGPRRTHTERVIVRHRARHTPKHVVERRFFKQRRAHYRPYFGRKARTFYRRPYGFRRPWPGHRAFISLGGVFYTTPTVRYVVVNRPPETVVVRETSTIVRPIESVSGNVVVTVSTLNVRTGPDLDYSLLGQVEEGSVLELHGKTDDWSYVRLPDGRFGWITSVFTEPLEPGSG